MEFIGDFDGIFCWVMFGWEFNQQKWGFNQGKR
jgi:hypothetical protein